MTDAWRYIVTPRAGRDMRQLSPRSRRRVFGALDHFVTDPERGDARKLRGIEDEWRLRVGDLRIRFRRDDSARRIVVLRVLPRGRAYRD